GREIRARGAGSGNQDRHPPVWKLGDELTAQRQDVQVGEVADVEERRVPEPTSKQIGRHPDAEHRVHLASATRARVSVRRAPEDKELHVLVDGSLPAVAPGHQPAQARLAYPAPRLQRVPGQPYGWAGRTDGAHLREVVPRAHEKVVNGIGEGTGKEEHIGHRLGQLPPGPVRLHPRYFSAQIVKDLGDRRIRVQSPSVVLIELTLGRHEVMSKRFRLAPSGGALLARRLPYRYGGTSVVAHGLPHGCADTLGGAVGRRLLHDEPTRIAAGAPGQGPLLAD